MSTFRLALPRAASLSRLGGSLSRLPSRLLHHAALARSRRSLSLLDDHLLRDIGLTREEALAEAERPAWDAPSHWKG
jgi:uncharacterized protein YjiS (DUF1127 family)